MGFDYQWHLTYSRDIGFQRRLSGPTQDSLLRISAMSVPRLTLLRQIFPSPSRRCTPSFQHRQPSRLLDREQYEYDLFRIYASPVGPCCVVIQTLHSTCMSRRFAVLPCGLDSSYHFAVNGLGGLDQWPNSVIVQVTDYMRWKSPLPYEAIRAGFKQDLQQPARLGAWSSSPSASELSHSLPPR